VSHMFCPEARYAPNPIEANRRNSKIRSKKISRYLPYSVPRFLARASIPSAQSTIEESWARIPAAINKEGLPVVKQIAPAVPIKKEATETWFGVTFVGFSALTRSHARGRFIQALTLIYWEIKGCSAFLTAFRYSLFVVKFCIDFIFRVIEIILGINFCPGLISQEKS